MEEILIRNLYWMMFNADLAVLAILFGVSMLKTKKAYVRWAFFFLWVVFIPNTLYILTDIYHLPDQWYQVTGALRLQLLFQYIFFIPLGVITYILAMDPFEKLLLSSTNRFIKKYAEYIIFFGNFIIALGIVMGRVQRTNSWEIFTNTISVFHDTVRTISSLDLIIVTIVTAFIANCIYFGLKNMILRMSFAVYKKITGHLF